MKTESLIVESAERRSCGFTLIEMLTVIVIIAILASMSGAALLKGRELARRAKAESELRSLVEAFQQYYALYEKWPPGASTSGFQPVTRSLLQPLIDSSANERGIVFLNLTLPDGKNTFDDPWGRPYEMVFSKENKEISFKHAFQMTVDFANRDRQPPYIGE